MKKMITTLALSLSVNVFAADSTANSAMSPKEKICAMVMCLIGEAMNGGIAECNEYLEPFYAIEIFTAMIFDPEATWKARRKSLNACDQVDDEQLDEATNADRRSDVLSGYYLSDGTELTWNDIYLLRVKYGSGVFDIIKKAKKN